MIFRYRAYAHTITSRNADGTGTCEASSTWDWRGTVEASSKDDAVRKVADEASNDHPDFVFAVEVEEVMA